MNAIWKPKFSNEVVAVYESGKAQILIIETQIKWLGDEASIGWVVV